MRQRQAGEGKSALHVHAATPAPAPTPTPESHPTPADQRRAQQIERIAQQAARDLERYKHKISQREERDRRRAEIVALLGEPE